MCKIEKLTIVFFRTVCNNLPGFNIQQSRADQVAQNMQQIPLNCVECEFEGCFEKAQATFKLLDKSGKLVGTKETAVSEKVSVSFDVAEPELWSAEHPNLYTLLIEVANEGRLLEITEQKVGIRNSRSSATSCTSTASALFFTV